MYGITINIAWQFAVYAYASSSALVRVASSLFCRVRRLNTIATMGKAKIEEPVDPTAWMLDNDIANFVLVNQKEVMYMCMVSVPVAFSCGGDACW